MSRYFNVIEQGIYLQIDQKTYIIKNITEKFLNIACLLTAFQSSNPYICIDFFNPIV